MTRHPYTPLPPASVMAALAEDPEAAHAVGRLRARNRGEAYDPTRHHPLASRPRRGGADPVAEGKLAELLERWRARGNPYRTPERRRWLEVVR